MIETFPLEDQIDLVNQLIDVFDKSQGNDISILVVDDPEEEWNVESPNKRMRKGEMYKVKQELYKDILMLRPFSNLVFLQQFKS